MARTIDEIQQGMLDDIAADATLSTVATNTSTVAIFRLFTRIVATCAWTVEVLFDTLKQELNDLLAALKPHTTRWYANKAKSFQYGFSLLPDSDSYNNTGFTDEQIEASKIVKYAAVVEGVDSKLRIKVAREDGGDLGPLSAPQLLSFKEYIALVKDAGVKVLIESNSADSLKLDITIYYDPLILNSNGQRLDGLNDTPVQAAIRNYLKSLPFNGVFVIAFLVDAIQKVNGVVIPHVTLCQTKYAAFPFVNVNVQTVPNSGYIRIQDADLTITFTPQTQLV